MVALRPEFSDRGGKAAVVFWLPKGRWECKRRPRGSIHKFGDPAIADKT